MENSSLPSRAYNLLEETRSKHVKQLTDSIKDHTKSPKGQSITGLAKEQDQMWRGAIMRCLSGKPMLAIGKGSGEEGRKGEGRGAKAGLQKTAPLQ